MRTSIANVHLAQALPHSMLIFPLIRILPGLLPVQEVVFVVGPQAQTVYDLMLPRIPKQMRSVSL